MRESAPIACQALLKTIMRGAQRMAFNPVVGGGPNASVIHYSRNDQKIKDGDLVLMDIGYELHGYLSDLTRTWPTSGHFSPAQEELYDLILETNEECIKLCKPGQEALKGLAEIGVLQHKSDVQHYNKLNPTAIGHYLGMDVHDSSAISTECLLKPGVVVTIEPGIYLPSSFDVPDRIEDEVLITETGYEVLTGSMPQEVQHIKSLLNDYSHVDTRRVA
ncbi:hypothetical protein MKX01_014411 [Papaver californicum]|nr:hypothetical protein MKX01_014411 [Papaver californicum]